GIYHQDDRALRAERTAQKLEPAYQCMVRVRIPGGQRTPAHWLAVDELAGRYAGGARRPTSRQSSQLHGWLKRDQRPAPQGGAAGGLTTVAACGDVNRTIAVTSLPEQSRLHRAVFELAERTNRHLLPATRGYHEVWLDEERAALPAGE